MNQLTDLAAAPATAFLFIDSRVPDLQAIIAATEPGVAVVVLDPTQDGVLQIAQALAGQHDLASISIVSHGDQGVLLLGDRPLFAGNLDAHQADLQAIGAALGEQGDILLYGCDVGAGDEGAAFLAALAQATGADIAASTDSTSGGTRGDWDLEISTGTIEGPVLRAADLADYAYELVTASVATVAALKAAIATGNTDGVADFITLTGNITFASAADAVTINVTDGQTMSIVGGGFTLSGNDMARVLDVTAGSVAISNLTITRGFLTGAGGAVTGNGAGGAGGDALGAGIRNAGTLTITGSTITNNHAAGGGGGGGVRDGQFGGGGAGGGGSGIGTTSGAAGGSNFNPTSQGTVIAGNPGTAGAGGTGAGFATYAGTGGTTSRGGTGGGNGGSYYTAGGNGGFAGGVGGGGGGSGREAPGGRGGIAVGGIYNTGTLTLTNSSITNNAGAGGGGGGGAGAAGTAAVNTGGGGAGGAGTGAIANVGGTVVLDPGTNATLATGNTGSGGAGGAVGPFGGNTTGANGTATATIATSGGGSSGVLPSTTIATKSFSADTGSSSTDFITRTAAQTISGTTSANLIAGEFVQVSIDNGATWTTATSSVGSNTWSINKTLTTSDTLQVRVSNAVGAGTASTQPYVLDSTAPAAPSTPDLTAATDSGSSSIDNLTNVTTPAFFGTAETGSIVTLFDTNGTTQLGTATATGGNWSITSSTLSQGTHTLTVKATDIAGNTGSASSSLSVTVDTTAPTTTIASKAFSADTGSSSTDFITSVAAQAISGMTSANVAAGEIVEISIDNGATWSTATTVVGANTWSLNSTLTASNTVQVRVTDSAGNSGAVSTQAYVLDTTAPAAPSTPDMTAGTDSGSSSTDNLTNVTTPAFFGTAESGASVTLFDSDGTTQLGTATATGGNWSITSSTLSQGTHTLTVKATDTAGNVSAASSALSVTVDSTPPTTTIATKSFSADTGSSSTDFITKTAAQTISGTTSANLAAGEIVEVSIDNGATWSPATTSAGSNTWSINRTLTASNTLQVRVSDTAGNSSAASTQAYVLDTSAPSTTIATLVFSADTGTSATDFITKTASQTISGTTSTNLVAGEIVEVSIDNGATWSAATTSAGANTWTINKTLTASNTLQVRVSDTAGNSSAASTQAYVLDTSAPGTTIASLAFSADTGTSATDFITKTAAQTISGTTNANLVAGEIVEVSIDNGSTWSTATTSAGANTWTTNKTLTTSDTLQVRVIDTAGNAGAGSTQAYVLDTSAPATTIATLAFSADTGTSATDFITRTAAQTISGTTSANLAVGEIVEVSIDNGATWSTATTVVGANTWSLNSTLTASNTVQVRVTDSAGNSGAVSTQAYVLDTTAPAAPSTPDMTAGTDSGSSSTDNLTNVTTPAFFGTAESGSIVTLFDSDGTTQLGTATATGGNWSITSSSLSQGAHTLTVKATDTAGNVSVASSALSVTVDATAPSTTVASKSFSADTGSSSTDFITNIATQTISGTTSANLGAGEIVEVSIDNGATWGTATTSVGANTWSINRTLTASNTLQVRVSDTAGNSSAASTQAYVLDTSAPSRTIATLAFSPDTGTSTTDFITNTAAQTISGTTSANLVAGEIVEVSIDNGATWSSATTSVGVNTWSANKTLTASGTLQVRVSDTAGNAGAATAQAYVLDTTAPTTPAAPDMTAGTDSGISSTDNVTSTTAPTFTGTAEAGAAVTLYDTDGTTVLGTTTATGGNWSITSSALGTGAHTVTAKAVDAAGNTSSASAGLSVTIDTTAPAAPSAPDLAPGSDSGNSSADNLTSTMTPTFTGTAEAGATVTLYDSDGTTVLGTGAASGGNWSITSSALADGAHTLTAKATDAAGTTSAASAGLSVTIDITAPAAPGAPDMATASDSGSSSSDDVTSTTTPTFSGTAEAGAAVTLYDSDGTTVLGTATATAGNWSITSSALADGTHTLTARATDAAGNTGTASAALSLTIDATAPAAPGTPDLAAGSDSGSSSIDDVTANTMPTVAGTAEAGATVTLFDTDGTTVLGTAAADGGGAWSITSASLAEGAHTLTATATDAAGNTSPASAALAITVDATAPIVTSASTTASSRSYKAGEVLAIQLNFSEAVTVSGTPQLTLETGATDRVVDYVAGSGTGTLTFNYTVQAGDTNADLDYIGTGALALNGGTIRDTAGNDAATALPAPGSADSLAADRTLAVDGVAPVFLSASADGAALQMRYSKPLNATNLPPASAFTVRAGGNSIAITSVAFDVAANVVLLTLGTAVSEGQALTLGYTDPTAGDDANALQDQVGNDAASFGGVAVTNVTVDRPAGTATVTVTTADGAPPQAGQPLTIDLASISDPEGIQAGSLSFQWLRDGASIPGARGSSYAPGVDDVGAQLSVTISYVDGRNHPATLVVPIAQKVSDDDGVATATESLAPAFHAGGAQGDGNGDGILDAFQVGVTSTSLPGTGALDTRFITLVADSARGAVDNTDAHLAVISDFAAGGITGNAPANVRFDSSLAFVAGLGTLGLTEQFSVFVDDSQAAHGFWVQDSAGNWRNATSAIETVDGKTRIDFMVEDGGAFDRDGVVNGEIQIVGVVADAPVGIAGLVPVFVTGDSFWF